MRSNLPLYLSLAGLVAFGPAAATLHADAGQHVPSKAPRTLVQAGREEAFRAYVTTGAGRETFARIKADFDAHYLDAPFPAEPLTYGDPEPRLRDSAKADLWRDAQDITGMIGGVAEAATLIWTVTGEDRYFAKAREFLLGSIEWSLDASGWAAGPGPGATDIYYNDEAHFRLWRKLPQVYDRLRDRLSAEDRARIVAHFRERGDRSFAWTRGSRLHQVQRNSAAARPPSHPVRFVAMTGLAGLALWDDLPQARQWWQFAYEFYKTQFPPWGGDDGGWAEGTAYWRGTMEHAAFQDTLLAIGHPQAYADPFWRQTGYFMVYNIQPYLASTFGDLSNAGRFNLEPGVAEYLEHLARVLQDGYLQAFAQMRTDERAAPSEAGLRNLNRIYPISTEGLIRNFTASSKPAPAPRPLSELPANRWFRDVGWVSMRSALGQPDRDIHITFKSSPYGSFSHSHPDQNAFVLNAFGESLAIASGYREFHRSPHHVGWTWQTKSKNAVLIDGKGQAPQSLASTGEITRFEQGDRYAWTTGDATVAYQTEQPAGRVKRVLRDLVFIDQRYLVTRDTVELADPGSLAWLLHAYRPIQWQADTQTAFIRGERATLTTRLVSAEGPWKGQVRNEFDVPVDPKYLGGHPDFSTRPWSNQSHFSAESPTPAASRQVWAVLWPEPQGEQPANLKARLDGDTLVVDRPDGKTDRLKLDGDLLELR
jgi:hypothetical protein